MKRIGFWFDFVSPYAYLAATQVEALGEKHGREVIWRPFLIGASLKVSGRKPPLQHPMVAEYTLNDVARTARLLGVDLAMPAKFPILSVNPSRLFCWLNDQSATKAKQFALAVYRAYFVDGRDISKPGVVAELVEPYGLGFDQALQLTKDESLKQQFKQGVDLAISKKVFGAPMLDIDGELFWGVDHLDQADHWLASGGW